MRASTLESEAVCAGTDLASADARWLMNRSKDDLLLERITRSLEGIEMLAAMWIEKEVPAGEIWVGEGPDRDLSRRPWRLSESERSRSIEKPMAPDRVRHIEERLDRLASGLTALEARVHEEHECSRRGGFGNESHKFGNESHK